MPKCIECGCSVASLYKEVERQLFWLARCRNCQQTCDIYIEYDLLILLLEIMLLKECAYRHVLFNCILSNNLPIYNTPEERKHKSPLQKVANNVNSITPITCIIIVLAVMFNRFTVKPNLEFHGLGRLLFGYSDSGTLWKNGLSEVCELLLYVLSVSLIMYAGIHMPSLRKLIGVGAYSKVPEQISDSLEMTDDGGCYSVGTADSTTTVSNDFEPIERWTISQSLSQGADNTASFESVRSNEKLDYTLPRKPVDLTARNLVKDEHDGLPPGYTLVNLAMCVTLAQYSRTIPLIISIWNDSLDIALALNLYTAAISTLVVRLVLECGNMASVCIVLWSLTITRLAGLVIINVL